MLRIGNTPEVTVVPFGFTYRYLVGKFLEQMFIACITVCTFPAGSFHEIGAQRFFAFIKRALSEAPTFGIGLSVVHRRVVNFKRSFITAVVDVLFLLLKRIVARYIDTAVVEFSAAIGHPVRNQFAGAGPVFYPDRYGIPQATRIGGLTK